MTSMRRRFDLGDHRFFKIYLDTGEKLCCVKVIPITTRGKLEGMFQCDHLPRALYWWDFVKACKKCIKEMQEILEKQEKTERSEVPPGTTRISVEHQSAKV